MKPSDVKPKAWSWLLLVAGAMAWPVLAQTTTVDDTDCPRLPEAAQQTTRWEALRLPSMLFCRALSADTGVEIFTVTIGRDSPFRPRRGDRAEPATIEGRSLFWYRAEQAGKPKVLARETLIELGPGRVAHVFVTASDPESLARHQQLVQSLGFGPASP